MDRHGARSPHVGMSCEPPILQRGPVDASEEHVELFEDTQRIVETDISEPRLHRETDALFVELRMHSRVIDGIAEVGSVHK